jgi:hypothetical protein
MWLSDAIISDVKDANVRVFYLTGSVATTWNKRRKGDEPAVFSGHYWAKGDKEGGPFKTISACYRDAHYRIVLKIAPPTLERDQHQIEVAESRRQLRQKNIPAKKRIA